MRLMCLEPTWALVTTFNHNTIQKKRTFQERKFQGRIPGAFVNYLAVPTTRRFNISGKNLMMVP